MREFRVLHNAMLLTHENISGMACGVMVTAQTARFYFGDFNDHVLRAVLQVMRGWRALALLVIACMMTSGYAGPCPSGWTLYTDDGSEGHDSCIALFTPAASYYTANATCGAQGGHLLTAQTTTRNSGILAAAAALSTSTVFMVGCSQYTSTVARGTHWYWIDGTDGANINCGDGTGAAGCGIWNSGEPK